MILEIDAGNTRIKWRILGPGSEVQASGACTTPGELLDSLDGYSVGIERIRLVSVRNRSATQDLCASVREVMNIEPMLARTESVCGGLVNSYTQPATMGVDRWLLMLAAWNRVRSACCVVGCGTAITVDVIDHEGKHAGGYIFPGLTLQRRCLLENTSIPLESGMSWQSGWSDLRLGTSTAEAVNHGIFACIVRGLAGIPELADAAAQGRLFLAGGDASAVASGLTSLGLSCRYEPDLVLDGLRHAIP
jgi:type III pantothenate kinase